MKWLALILVCFLLVGCGDYTEYKQPDYKQPDIKYVYEKNFYGNFDNPHRGEHLIRISFKGEGALGDLWIHVKELRLLSMKK